MLRVRQRGELGLGHARRRSAPPIQTSPRLGLSRPAIRLSSVVLPEPDGPMMPRNSPSATSRLRLRSTVIDLAAARERLDDVANVHDRLAGHVFFPSLGRASSSEGHRPHARGESSNAEGHSRPAHPEGSRLTLGDCICRHSKRRLPLKTSRAPPCRAAGNLAGGSCGGIRISTRTDTAALARSPVGMMRETWPS